MKNVCLIGIYSLFIIILFCSCKTQKGGYMHISASEAKKIMDSENDYVILDVRTTEEFEDEHIDGAMLIPDYALGERAEKELPDKSQLILVYCRSGNRSQNAANILVSLGYTNVKEFGGIIDWKYGTVKKS